MKTYLREDVVAKILPIYQRIATSELLEKCKGDTQNSNESLHSVIWNELPKTKFFSLQRMMYGVYRSVITFNHGATALATAMEDSSLKARQQIDRKRLRSSIRSSEKKEEEKEKKIRKNKRKKKREKLKVKHMAQE
ncbi:uncharacterized protein LOC143027775 isoform X1 [Oratosquilla oratoria]|uniref:uncharacterized protein LOC143027775 isoform X1 n=1 Tax=Oratosquilla oratoria TaxID=337810 RepID=UPI003F776F2F